MRQPAERPGLQAGPESPTRADRVRQVAVTAAEVFCVLGTLVGLGVLGARVEESSGGALAADATLVAPAGPAFSIWTVIYLGLAGYTLWQWLPAQGTQRRARETGWLVASTMVLNAAWLLVTQQGWIWASVAVIAVLVVTLGVLVGRLTEIPSGGGLETVLVDGTFGLYLGWVTVATGANVAAAFVASGLALPTPGDPTPYDEAAAVVVLAAATGAGVLMARRLGARWAVAGAIGWGLAWVAVGRLADQPRSVVTGVAAVVGAAIVLLVTARQRLTGSRAP